jgi:hypothetical protein
MAKAFLDPLNVRQHRVHITLGIKLPDMIVKRFYLDHVTPFTSSGGFSLPTARRFHL